MESSVEFFIDLGIVIGSLLTTNLDSSSKAVQFFSWWRFKLSLLKNASPQSHFIFSSLCTRACLERLLCRGRQVTNFANQIHHQISFLMMKVYTNFDVYSMIIFIPCTYIL